MTVDQQDVDSKEFRRSRAIGWALTAVVLFSLSLPMTRLALAAFDPWALTAWRSLAAAVLAIGYLLHRQSPWPRPSDWVRVAGVSLGVVVGFPLGSAYALTAMPTPRAAVITAILPAATAVIAALRGGEKPGLEFWLASGLGAVLTFAFAVGPGPLIPSSGDLAMVAAVLLCAFGYAEGGVAARRLGGPETICWALVVAAPLMLCGVWFRPIGPELATTPMSAWAGLGYLTVISAFLGFFAWYHALALGGVARTSQMQLCAPLLTLFWSIFLGEPPSGQSMAFAVVILGCVLVAQKAGINHAS